MHAAVLTSPDTDPIYTDFPDPEPFPGREPLTLVAAGMHQVVRSIATGRHYGSTGNYPLVPGVDAVARHDDGTLVYTGFTTPPWGTMAEKIATSFDLALPASADPLAVAAGMNPGMPGYMTLTQHMEQRGQLGTVLVLGATGMAGRIATQIALGLGASRVIAVGRDVHELEALQVMGAEPISIATSSRALESCVQEEAPSLILDFLWGSAAESLFAALGRSGLDDDTADISWVQIGSLAGTNAALPASLLRSRRITISGHGAGSASMEELLAKLPRLMAMIADGTITVPYTAYPLERIADAWNHTGRTRAVVTL
ncbi:MAG: zinc-binding alcohol dehydrogenase family protein [Thermomicrobiales bacterium]|nr:zinc-binding alcohol dehydrogenase family protein [Thermomicrobiales bacterium]